MSNLKKSTLYTRQYSVTTPSGQCLILTALTFKELDNIFNLYEHNTNSLKFNTVNSSIHPPYTTNDMSIDDIQFLYDIIIDISTLTQSDYETVMDSISILKAGNFKGDDWKCENCQKVGFDKHRNCPLLDEEFHDKSVKYVVDNKILTICPMDAINTSNLISDALPLASMYSKGILPMAGGLVDQTSYTFHLAGTLAEIYFPPIPPIM